MTCCCEPLASTPNVNVAPEARFCDCEPVGETASVVTPGPETEAVDSIVTPVDLAAGVRFVMSTSVLAATDTVTVTCCNVPSAGSNCASETGLVDETDVSGTDACST